MLRVPIASLPEGVHQDTFRPTADDLGLDPETFSNLEVDVQLNIAERRVLAAYTVRATARLVCDRTLDDYDQPIEGSHAVLFTAEAAADGAEDADDDIQPLPSEATHLDLTASVHDTVLLAVPLRRISPAAEAAEIPHSFGAPADDDEQTDARWAALKGLRPDGDGAS